MAKISALPLIDPAALTGEEALPVSKGILTSRVSLDAIVARTAQLVGSGRTFFVDLPANGASAANDGSIGAPWTKEWAVDPANTRLREGDLVLYRGSPDGNNPRTYNLLSADGLRVQKSGKRGKPITYAVMPGEHAEISGRRALTFERIVDEPGRQIYRSLENVPRGCDYLNGSVLCDGMDGPQWYPLVFEKIVGSFDATSQIYRADDGIYYTGPMIKWEGALGGKILIRLDPPTAEAQLVAETGRSFVTPPSTNPNQCQLAISTGYGVMFGGSYIDWQVPVVDCYLSFGRYLKTITTADRGRGITVHNGYDRPLYQSFSRACVDEFEIYDWDSDGSMRRDWWVGYSDIKYGKTNAERARRLWEEPPSNTDVYRSTGSRIYRVRVRNFFDGPTGGADFDCLVGGACAPAGTSEEAKWEYACDFENIWDDAFQIYYSRQGLRISHCRFFGAGISRDGSGSNSAKGGRGPSVRDCIFDQPHMIFFGRKGAVDGDTGISKEGMAYPTPFMTHGIKQTATDYEFPMDFQRNTVNVRLPNVQSDPLMQRAVDLGVWLAPAGKTEGQFNDFFNNVFAFYGPNPINGVSLGNKLFLDKGRDRWDGTLVLIPADWTPGKFFPAFDVRNGADILIDPRGGTDFRSFAEIRANATALEISKLNYPSGIASTDLQLVDPPAMHVEPVGYRPTSVEARTGAIDTALIGGPQVYRPARGAKA